MRADPETQRAWRGLSPRENAQASPPSKSNHPPVAAKEICDWTIYFFMGHVPCARPIGSQHRLARRSIFQRLVQPARPGSREFDLRPWRRRAATCFANSTFWRSRESDSESGTPHRTHDITTMNVTAPLSRRPLGCLKAGLCQSLIRGYATAVAASTTQSTGALPDHNFCTASRHRFHMSSDLPAYIAM